MTGAKTASAIGRMCEANEPQAVALIALHGLARDVVGVGVPAALAQIYGLPAATHFS